MGFCESEKKILAPADYHHVAPFRGPHRLESGECGGAVYLYFVLKEQSSFMD